MPAAVEWVQDAAGLAALAPEWDALAADAPEPFCDHAWFDAWWRAFGSGSLAVCSLREGSRITALYPLRRQRGSTLALANAETPAFRPLARDPDALWAVTRAVLAGAPALELSALPELEPPYSALRECARELGRLELVTHGYDSPFTAITGTFDDYRAERKAHWRELERRGRKLAREHDVRLRCVESPADPAAELEAGLALEAAGWKGRSQTAILSAPATAAFYRDYAARAHARGELRLSQLHVDGRLAAFDLAIVHRERYFLLKTAFDERLRNLSPGLVLRRAVVERCFELGLSAHEFLGVDMPWKQLFATGRRAHVAYRAYRRTPEGAARLGYRAARAAARHQRRAAARRRGVA